MEIESGKYRIILTNEKDYDLNSTDNLFKFDNHFSDGKDFWSSTKIGIKVYRSKSLIKSAILTASGGENNIHENSYLILKESIIICCSNMIFSLSIPSLTLSWKTKVDDATCFEIFKLNDDYIIHGELAISRISKAGKIIWQKTGLDIFTTLTDENNFKITDKYIFTTDFNNRKYKFDFEGNELESSSLNNSTMISYFFLAPFYLIKGSGLPSQLYYFKMKKSKIYSQILLLIIGGLVFWVMILLLITYL